MGGASGLGRTNVNNQPTDGTALTREQYAAQQLAANTPTPPPSAAKALAAGISAAQDAAAKQRRRAQAGSKLTPGTILTGPTANLQPKTLLGS